MAQTPGRNDPCPCGSGKKFKRCHGGLNSAYEEMISRGAAEAQKQAEIHRLQLTRQQGRGRGIVAACIDGLWIVFVGRRRFTGRWQTFHDFLFSYIIDVLGRDWFQQESQKDETHRHPVLSWHSQLSALSKTQEAPQGLVKRIPITGAVNGFLTLAYDLYTLEHNEAETQKPGLKEHLLDRLRHIDQFVGARYEVRVAAMLHRAGFLLDWEDESDRRQTHCEFTATYPPTGKAFGVECKIRNRAQSTKSIKGFGKFVGLVNEALQKSTPHDRLVFVDINTPAPHKSSDGISDWRTSAVGYLRTFEGGKDAVALPPAVVFITCFPDHYHLSDLSYDAGAIVEGFKTPDYRTGQPTTIRKKVEQRDRNIEIEALFSSMVEHNEVPSTFDGTIPGVDDDTRLIIGRRYQLDDGTIGQLEDACVDPVNESVAVILSTDDGRRVICRGPLSKDELAAWRRYPETFFGDVRQGKHEIEDPIDLFEVTVGTYSKASKEKLLEIMAPQGGKAREALSAMTQAELAKLYAEGITNSLLSESGAPPVPLHMQRMRRPPNTE